MLNSFRRMEKLMEFENPPSPFGLRARSVQRRRPDDIAPKQSLLRRRIKNERGLTLVEMMVSMVVLSLVVLGCVFVLVQARQMSEEARMRLLATTAAKSVLDLVKNTAVSSVNATTQTIGTTAASSFVPAGLPNGTITFTTNPSPTTSTTTLATVTVRVQWTGSKNSTRTLNFTTMRSSY